MSIPRPEYPRPQFVRDRWLCLNGQWQFEIDPGDSGLERGLRERELAGEITVPFCPESKLSGVGNTDFLNAVWYRRQVAVPDDWAGCQVLLHFQAVDYDATVWCDGIEVGRHRGGFTPFECNLGPVAGQTVTLVVRARDDHRLPTPKGKQSDRFENYGCHYTRTTGIWQTVWMEPVPASHLRRPRITPDVQCGCFHVETPLAGSVRGSSVAVALSNSNGQIVREQVRIGDDFTPRLSMHIPADRRRVWSPQDPHLYDLRIELLDANGELLDVASSYAGLRGICIDGPRVLLNGRPVFQRLVLDQGYYPDGIMTAPSDEALRGDIELAMDAGFNGARLHQKVFEERFLHHADRLGYLVWGEFADWEGTHHARPGVPTVAQWLEAVARDYNHPCIVGWCPLNETARELTDRIDDLDDATRALFAATKLADSTRPVLDASGYSHRVAEADIYDAHNYNQDPDALSAQLKPAEDGRMPTNPFDDRPRWSLQHRGQPCFLSEFGGTWWNPEAAEGEASWGYGNRPRTIEEFYDRFERLVAVLRDNPGMFGYCWTQLTDVFQEQNGIYTFDRRAKFDVARLRAVQQRPAAIEIETCESKESS